MNNKTCTKCNIEKPLSGFHKGSRYKGGYRAQCKECANAKGAEWYQSNKAKHQEDGKAWLLRNPGKQAEYHKTWSAKNPKNARERARRRQAVKLGAFVEDVLLSVLRERDGSACYLCLEALDFDTPRAVHIEHKTPFSRGGEHSYANTALACASCNLRKHAKTEEEFRLILKTMHESTSA